MRCFVLILLFVIVVDGCIDPLEVAIPEVGFQLVVDGYITNEPGPYTVKLYRARPLETDLDRLVPERYARVTLRDNAGNSEQLTEITDGVYQTQPNGIQGQIGRSYSIEVITNTGRKFYSEPEEIKPVGFIESVRYEYVPGSTEKPEQFRIFVDGEGDASTDDLTRFRMVGTYKVETFPERRMTTSPAGVRVPNPFPCSGYYVNSSGALTKGGECFCCICWVNQYDEIPVVYNEQLTGNTFRNLEVGRVTVTPTTFYEKYRVEVQQMSITESTYQFWNLVRAQKLGATDLFQPPSAPIQGNIKSADENEAPLGIFWAAGISKRAIFIEQYELPNGLKPIDTLVAPCNFYEYSTSVMPEFWR